MQCYGCTHFTQETTDYGQTNPAECAHVSKALEVMEDGSAAELIVDLLQDMAFRLSHLNNCPYFEDKHKAAQRRSILDLANKAP